MKQGLKRNRVRGARVRDEKVPFSHDDTFSLEEVNVMIIHERKGTRTSKCGRSQDVNLPPHKVLSARERGINESCWIGRVVPSCFQWSSALRHQVPSRWGRQGHRHNGSFGISSALQRWIILKSMDIRAGTEIPCWNTVTHLLGVHKVKREGER